MPIKQSSVFYQGMAPRGSERGLAGRICRYCPALAGEERQWFDLVNIAVAFVKLNSRHATFPA